MMHNNFKKLIKIASKSSVPVLFYGESGTGKEVAARALHAQSRRARGPFIAVNCGALAKNLIENLLEGSKKGVYTGSMQDHKGLVRSAHLGTLFLDEIGEMPLDLQSRLLRVIQEKAVLPIGAAHSVPVDFRLVCATHRNLKELVLQKSFREDLFFRLHVFPIKIPALRERESELKTIAKELWTQIQENTEGFEYMNTDLTESELNTLQSYEWPGNVRQLKNILERYYLLKPYGQKLKYILEEESGFNVSPKAERVRSKPIRWDDIEEALELYDNNKTRAADFLGISRGSLCYQIKKHT
jgi:transcriptional regulator with PAS, ATPase and Fis domain